MKQKGLTQIAIFLGILTFFITCFIAFYTLTHQKEIDSKLKDQINSEVAKNKPEPGSNGKDAYVDYDKLLDYIDERIARLPSPQPGQNGDNGQDGQDALPGRNGLNGSDGKSTYQLWLEMGHTGSIADFLISLQGPQGVPGDNGKTPEIRCNEKKNQWEIRYSADENWVLMNGKTTKCTVEKL